ncbi:MAG: CGGC domain-containing protein [Candidatus Heimdallarchaeaceae archaeon]
MRRIGIIICDRYRDCDGGKCFRSLREREGAFKRYKDEEIEVVGYSTCGGCPGGNIETVAGGMKKYGAEVIHFATGFLAGYPPCPYIQQFKDYIEKVVGVTVVVGTHPMPTNYVKAHNAITDIPKEYRNYWKELIDEKESEKYDSSKENYSEILKEELETKRK